MHQEPGYGVFGNLSGVYDSIRPEVPDEILAYLSSNLIPRAKILDIGCGTGIVTRQLNGHGFSITGSDIDTEMINTAKSHNDSIQYVVSPAEQLPFENQMFDAVTSFSAFHWFANEAAVKEMQRVSTANGKVFIANRDTSAFREGYLTVLKGFITEPIPNSKASYDPKKVLEQYGYVDAEARTFDLIELLSILDAVSYVKSVSIWNLVPDIRKEEATGALATYFDSIKRNETVSRETRIHTVLARIS